MTLTSIQTEEYPSIMSLYYKPTDYYRDEVFRSLSNRDNLYWSVDNKKVTSILRFISYLMWKVNYCE